MVARKIENWSKAPRRERRKEDNEQVGLAAPGLKRSRCRHRFQDANKQWAEATTRPARLATRSMAPPRSRLGGEFAPFG